MAQKAAWLNGAGRVIGIDVLDYRLEIAKKAAKSEVMNLNQIDVVKALREMTEGRGADVCVDAVGMEASRNLGEKTLDLLRGQAGTCKVINTCASAVRRNGIITIVGVYATRYHFPLGQLFDKAISVHMGQAPAQNYIDHLLQLVYDKKVILNDILTHTLPLSQAAHGYDIFCNKKDNCLKIILKP